jgi:hypothetical protein
VKPEVRLNLFGANIGGLIRKEKTFFFDYEGERNRDGVIYQGIVPTPQVEQGDFSNIPAGFPRRCGLRRTIQTTRVPYPNGIIPKSFWSPVSTRIVSNPDFPVTTPGAYVRTRSDKFDIRLDQYVTSNCRMFGRYSFFDLELFRSVQFKGYVECSFNDGFGTAARTGLPLTISSGMRHRNRGSRYDLEIRIAAMGYVLRQEVPRVGGALLPIPRRVVQRV